MKPQTPWDPNGTAPPLEGDPRAKRCEKHQVLLYPGELCRICASDPEARIYGDAKHLGDALEWIERNVPQGVRLVAKALTESAPNRKEKP